MKVWDAAVILVAGTAAQSLTVWVNSGFNVSVIRRARITADKIMNDAGVHIEWRSSVKQCENTQGSIFIDISNRTLETRHSGAFAYALPYEGTRIVLFYDRVLEITWPGRVPGVLGHVLAHEITHVLQGVARHSGVGVMKAKWDYLDHGEMQHNYLKLTGEDICLIRTGKFEVALR